MSIVEYFEKNGRKVFDVVEALSASGWNVLYEDLLEISGLHLVSRDDPHEKITIKSVVCDTLSVMYYVHFEEGGWLCLDHVIEQYQLEIP